MADGNGFRVHLLVPHYKGAVESRGMRFMNQPLGGGRYGAACNPTLTLSPVERGTGEPKAVQCAACEATAAYRELRAAETPKAEPATAGAAPCCD